MRCVLPLFMVFILSNSATAQTFKMEPGPKSPAESLKCIQTRPGFTVELMAAEPLVMDPIAFAWGPDGKFWVVEMGDYPLGVDGKGKFGGKVKYLEKANPPQPPLLKGGRRITPPLTKGGSNESPPLAKGGPGGVDEGPYTKSTTFLDNLGYPTGVTPYGKGVIITCAPDIFYAEDTDGDGKADKKIILFTGFKEGNQQHRVNGLVWGLDNWLYGANGDSGGGIKAVNALQRQPDGGYNAILPLHKGQERVNISGRDFRLKPETGEIEAVTGQTQFGRCRDDFGNWFGCNNSNPMYHFVLEDRYLKRNPHILYPDPKVNVSETPGASRVYPISKPLPRFNSPQALNHFTSACSVMIYRDNLFGPEFCGNSFVAEPVHNLIHREIMKPKGVTFTSRRADDEQTSEFLASSDNWFRPTTIATGPDGAIWIADMYRYVIEHPEWIPLDWQRKLELRAGHDMGRIYRVYPKDKKPRAIPRMDKMSAKELVAALESPNGWVRDTAQGLLTITPQKEIEPLAEIVWECQKLMTNPEKRASSRIQALYLGDSVSKRIFSGSFSREDLSKAYRVWQSDQELSKRIHELWQDTDPEVRRHALRLGYHLGAAVTPTPKLLGDPSPQVRLELAFTLANDTNGGEHLAALVAANKDDRFITAAALSSVNRMTWPMFLEGISKPGLMPEAAVQSLLKLSRVYGKPVDAARILAFQLGVEKQDASAEQMLRLASLIETLEASQLSLQALAKELRDGNLIERVEKVFVTARELAGDEKSAVGDKVLAIRLLGRGLDHWDEDRRLLAKFLSPQLPEDVQAAAVQRLGGIFDPRVPNQFVAAWQSLSPSVRNQIVDVLLSRLEWTRSAIEALEAKKILPAEIDTIRRQKLLDHRDPEIRRAAAKVFAAATNPDRAKVVDQYWITLPEKGDSAKGVKLFEKHCAACHQLAGIGQQVGPDLASVGDKSPQGLLTAILDPNKAVEARYVNYVATTKAGLTLSGLLQSETSTTISLVGADGKKHDLLRKDLDELASTGKSVMPEGFEKEIPPAAMADLIAFLRGNLAKPKSFPGNRPELVAPGKDGALHLLATNASIFGKTLVFEEKYQNLGYWSSPDDQAVWSIDIPREGRYEVWLDFACDSGSAGNILALQIGDAKLTHKVAGTASWELYRKVKIGTLRLAAGRQEAALRPEGTIRGALFDLREVQLIPEKSD